MNNSIAWWPVVVVLAVACVTDVQSRRIPNWLVLPFGLTGVAMGGLSKGLAGLENSFSGISLAALVCGVFCYLRGMGMGDLKLCAAIGAWIGPGQLKIALVITFIAGALIGIIWAVCTKSLSKSLDSTGDLLAGFGRLGLRPHKTLVLDNPITVKLPFAPAIAIGTLISFFG